MTLVLSLHVDRPGKTADESTSIMKILWVKSDFLHPTTKGGHIRTLEMLRRLRDRHEIYYVAFDDGSSQEGVQRAGEYCAKAFPIPFRFSDKGSPRFFLEVAASLFSPVPVHVSRPRSDEMRRVVSTLMKQHRFDAMVCDFLTPSLNLPELERWVLFQHNVETAIWRRHADNAPGWLQRSYYRLQAGRLFRYERDVCRKVRHVIAVSDADAQVMKQEFGAARISAVPTGVDVEYFTPPADRPKETDLVFVGSMDWRPNVDGILYFTREILPRIRQQRPDCSLDIVGRSPETAIRQLALDDPLISVRGTVPDVRPYLWNARVSIVPLRIGGGTRLKIFESMAARVPVVSTTIGAEGLEVSHGENSLIADTPEAFAASCLDLLAQPARRDDLAAAGWALVNKRFSWEHVARQFESLLSLFPR